MSKVKIRLDLNPFAPTGIPRREVLFWANRREIKKKILNFVGSPPSEAVETLTIIGSYGQGKTHSLKYALQ